MLGNALQELEDRVRIEVDRTLAGTNDAGARQLDLARHAEDYTTWRRMGEAPAHVQVLAEKVAPSLPSAIDRDTLLTELVAMLERIYRDLGSAAADITPVRDHR